MARGELITVSVYLPDEKTKRVLEKAAERENRSVSNYLMTAGLERAREKYGIEREGG